MFEDILSESIESKVDKIVSQIRKNSQSNVDEWGASHVNEVHQKRVIRYLLGQGFQVIPVDNPVVILDGD